MSFVLHLVSRAGGLAGLLGLAALLAGPARAESWEIAPAEVVLGGPSSTELDLWRPWPDADKIYVMVGLPDGSSELFMVDTGASVSVIHSEVAERLGIVSRDSGGTIQGLGGATPWMRGTVPRIQLGSFQLNGLDVAVGVPGVPEYAGALPIAGILGNNVWANFVCVVDYPADVLELHLASAWKERGPHSRLAFDGAHATTVARIDARRDGRRARASVELEVDTGAQDLLFAGDTGRPFVSVSTRGMEPVLGVGVDLDHLPEADLLQVTRRIPVYQVKTGGKKVLFEDRARWVGSEGDLRGPSGLQGLLGYRVYGDYRVVFDFPHGRFALTESTRPPRDFNAARAYLEIVRARDGDAPEQAAARARLLVFLDDLDGARAEVAKGLAALPGDPELTVMLARVQRYDGDLEAALATLAALSPAALMEEDEWVAYINALVLAGRSEEAVRLAAAAVDAVDVVDLDRGEYLIAYSDALVGAGRLSEAAAQLDEASVVSQGRSAHLLRKARIAEIEGDRYGAIVALQRLMAIYPLDGRPMWLYGRLAAGADAEQGAAGPVAGERFTRDVDEALARLHPGDEPWDFVGAGFAALGNTERAHAALASGYERDCSRLPDGPDRANCDAWYWALAGERLPEAQARIAVAIGAEPQNSSYQDTAAVVAFAAGNAQDAVAHARKAALLAPDDPYLLWQLSRITPHTNP